MQIGLGLFPEHLTSILVELYHYTLFHVREISSPHPYFEISNKFRDVVQSTQSLSYSVNELIDVFPVISMLIIHNCMRSYKVGTVPQV